MRSPIDLTILASILAMCMLTFLVSYVFGQGGLPGGATGVPGAAQYGKLKTADQGTCTMTAGSCGALPLASAYNVAPNCFLTFTGTGTLAGALKVTSTTTNVTPASTTGTDTAVVNWVCFGN